MNPSILCKLHDFILTEITSYNIFNAEYNSIILYSNDQQSQQQLNHSNQLNQLNQLNQSKQAQELIPSYDNIEPVQTLQ